MNEYFKKHKVHLMAWVFFAVLKTIAAVLFALYMQKMIDAVSAMDAQKMLHTSIAGVVIVVCYAAFGYVGSYFEMKFSQKVLVDVRQDICKSIVSTDLDSYRLHKSAEYTSILNNDIGMLDEKYFLCLPNIVIQILTFLIATVTLYQMEPWLAFSAILLCAVPLIVPFLFGKQISARQKSYIHVLDWYNGKLKNIWNGYEVIKSYHVEREILTDYEKCNWEVERTHFSVRNTQNMSRSISGGVGFLIDVCMMGIAGILVLKGYVTVGILIATIQLMNYIQTPIQWISKLLADYKTSQPVLKRVTDILNLPKDADHGEKLKTALPISVENLRFSYEEGEEVLHNLSVTFEPGKKYAIVGNSGSGKSTFMYVLMHYYNHFEGEIRFGSQSISDIQKKELYRSIALIHQNVVVLDGTLRDNVSLYESYSDENIKQALIRAGMGDYLNEKGLDFTIQESGSNLSGGEKQRIAIARAFLRNTPVMILDEATSSLDSLMAAKIEQTVLQSDTTILNIVHQLKADSLKQYDEILVFSKGAIIERGNYDELIQKDGIFCSLLSVMSA